VGDNDLFRRYQEQGDNPAFRELVNRYDGKLLKKARGELSSLGMTEAVAEEVVQAVWGRLAQFKGPFRGQHPNSFKRLLWKVLKDTYLNTREYERRRKHVALADEREDFDLSDGLADDESGRRSSKEATGVGKAGRQLGRRPEDELVAEEKRRADRAALLEVYESL
jgi:DNA-directed RNA polymerase specialized sigma24 family protein